MEAELDLTHHIDINDRIFINPNPVDLDFVKIKIEDFNPDKIYSILIYDVYGRQTSSKIFASGNETLIMDENPGIYMATILVDGQVVSTQKLLKL